MKLNFVHFDVMKNGKKNTHNLETKEQEREKKIKSKSDWQNETEQQQKVFNLPTRFLFFFGLPCRSFTRELYSLYLAWGFIFLLWCNLPLLLCCRKLPRCYYTFYPNDSFHGERYTGGMGRTTDGGDEVKKNGKMEISETISRMKDEMLTKALYNLSLRFISFLVPSLSLHKRYNRSFSVGRRVGQIGLRRRIGKGREDEVN